MRRRQIYAQKTKEENERILAEQRMRAEAERQAIEKEKILKEKSEKKVKQRTDKPKSMFKHCTKCDKRFNTRGYHSHIKTCK